MVPKLDDFNQHNGRRKCIHFILGQKIDEIYTIFNTRHVKMKESMSL